MTQELTFSIKSLWFDEDYRPAANTRNTTNFANLARGSVVRKICVTRWR